MSLVDVHNINKLDIQKIRVTEDIGWQLRFVMTPHAIKAYFKNCHLQISNISENISNSCMSLW